VDWTASPLIETDWLAERLTNNPTAITPEMRIVDARWRGDGTSSRELYQAGHVPGAVHLDWQLDLSWTDPRGLRDLLLPPERFAQVMQAAGIGDETLVVAYADTDHSGAARLWWALRYYGHERVAVVNGGWTKWQAESRPISRTNPAIPASGYHFTPRPRSELMATATEIKQALEQGQPDVRLVDSRPPEQYQGQAVWTPSGSRFLAAGESSIEIGGRSKMRAGHIPGAISLHAGPLNLNQSDWTYLPPSILRARAEAAGLLPEQRIITYCGVGISASLGLFGLYLAGYRNLALYDASWEEWGTDPAYPVTIEEPASPNPLP